MNSELVKVKKECLLGGQVNYEELYERNQPIISSELQKKIKNLRVGVAGCGSTGGAVIDGFLRLGIENYNLCDNGSYELNNLNRQMVFQTDIGVNKSIVQKNRVLNVNPSAKVNVWDSGIEEENVDRFLRGIDFLFDAVDVTEASGMEMKLLLHEQAHKKKIPVGSALDLGYMQWLKSYNYHLGTEVLDGKLLKARAAQSPLKKLIEGFISVEEIPLELLQEVRRLIENPHEGACQLGSACFLLSAMMGPYITNFLNIKKFPNLVKIDLLGYFENDSEKRLREERTVAAQLELKNFLMGVL